MRSKRNLRLTRKVGQGMECLETRLALATVPTGFADAPIASGLDRPTAMAVAPDGRIFIAEQGGDLRVVKDGALLDENFLSLSVNSAGERGLLGVAFDPNFAQNKFVYVYYTTATSPIHNRVSRFTANGDQIVPGSEVVLLNLDNLSSATNHNGGALHFGTDGKLYVAVGENGIPRNSQTLSNLLGKILRINPTPGNIVPADNPFVGVAGARGEIWALGYRNPFTFSVQPTTGRIYVNDVGAVEFEEINRLVRGGNYGWPNAEGPDGGDSRYIDPIFAYRRDSGMPQGRAITGGAFYNPDTAQFPAEYTGDYFFADFLGNFIWKYDTATDTATEFATNLNGPVDLRVTANGELLYLQRSGGGATGELRSIRSLNQRPVIELSGDRVYREGAPPVPIAPTSFVTDVDSPNFGGGRLIVRTTHNFQPTDRLAILNSSKVTKNGSNVLVNGVAVGTFSGGAGTTPLVVLLNQQATPARVRILLRHVTFEAAQASPSTATRKIIVWANDGDGASSVVKSLSMRVVRASAASTATELPATTLGYSAGAPALALLANTTQPVIADELSGTTLRIQTTSGQQERDSLQISVPFRVGEGQVWLRDVVIGKIAAEEGQASLSITFNDLATADAVETLLRSIRFRTDEAASPGSRRIEVSLLSAANVKRLGSFVVNVA